MRSACPRLIPHPAPLAQVRTLLEQLDLSSLPPKEAEAAAPAPAAGRSPRPKKPRGEGTPGRRPPLPPQRLGGSSAAATASAGASLLDQLDMLASAAEAAGDFASPEQRPGGAAAAGRQAEAEGEEPAAVPPAAGIGGPPLGRTGSGSSAGLGGNGGSASLDPQVAAAAARKLQQRAVEAFAAVDSQSSDSMLKPFKLLLRAQPGSALFKVSRGAGGRCVHVRLAARLQVGSAGRSAAPCVCCNHRACAGLRGDQEAGLVGWIQARVRTVSTPWLPSLPPPPPLRRLSRAGAATAWSSSRAWWTRR